MITDRFLPILLACVLAGFVGAQTTINKTTPAVIGFVDISMTGGTAITGVDDETEHAFTTTIGNALFPAGPVYLGCNGVVQAGPTSGTIGFTNAAIPATGNPSGLVATPAFGSILAWWDDLDFTAASSTNVYWQEIGGVLYIMYKDVQHFSTATVGQQITFEIQVFSNPPAGAPWIQIIYPDAIFGGTQTASDNAASATIGYLNGSNTVSDNVQLSFNTASIFDGDVVSILDPAMTLNYSSPFGSGWLQIDIGRGPPSGTYFLCITGFAGNFPNGWLYGIDIAFGDLIAQGQGFPFVGPLNGAGGFTLGPIGPGVPPITLYSVVMGFTGVGLASAVAANSAPVSYTIP